MVIAQTRRTPFTSRALLVCALAALAIATIGLAPGRAAAAGLLAPQGACAEPAAAATGAPAHEAEETAMLCLTNFARGRLGEPALADNPSLQVSAAEKAEDILRCDSFSHFACGREFSYWIRAAGYTASPCWRIGENLAYGTSSLGGVRSIFRAWMRSPEHRANILGDFAEVGIYRDSGDLEGRPNTAVWAQHFGAHC
jgi:uncharacterized protein YkwD